jgi:hypothetical protein
MRIDEVVSGSITDCFIWTFRRVGFACCRTWLVSVVLRSPTNPLLVTPPRRRESRQAARQPLPFRRSWRVTSSGLISAKRNLTVVQFIRSRGGKRPFAARCVEVCSADKPAFCWRSECNRSILSRLQQGFCCDAAYVVETDIQQYRFQCINPAIRHACANVCS